MINQERLVESFINMTKIDSVSGQEREFALYLKAEMGKLKMEVLEDSQAAIACGAETGNLIGRLKGNSGKTDALMFCAHMDTVEPGQNIQPIIKDGIICSKGDTILGADDKSGIAAILEAIKCIQEKKTRHNDLEIVFTFGEELGLLGARYFDFELLKAKRGYVLDAGGSPGTIINRGPAQNNIKAVIHGKAAHAGICPEAGVSSIQVAARAIERMKLLRIDEDTTANIGKINGGKATNIVCDSVILEGEARSLSDLKLEVQTHQMVEALQKACNDFGARLEYETKRVYPTFYVHEKEKVIELARAAGDKIGLDVQIKSTGGGSDVHFFNAAGICTVNLATGMNKVHSQEEEIRIIDLINLARFVEAIIEEDCKRIRPVDIDIKME